MNDTPTVSRRQAEVIDAITSRDVVVFGPQEIERFLDVSSRNAYRILNEMVEKGLARRLARGRYVLEDTYESLDSYALASQLEPASYVGFWSALHFHGLTEQVPQTIFVAVTTQKRSLDVQGQTVRFVRVSRESFFGYDRYDRAVVSDPPKTILDCLRLPEYAGGVRAVARAIPDDLDVDRVVRYARRLDNGAVAARVGYLLDQKDMLDADARESLRGLLTSYTALDPSGERTNPVSAWKCYANVDIDD
jgi:predicted transcriptional regulator of viral defense system